MARTMAEPVRALVFQCRVCRTIVADSLTIVRTNEAQRTVALSEVAAAVESSTEVAGSTDQERFKHLQCASCSAALGRRYSKTAPEAADDVGLFLLDTEALTSYELGSSRGQGASTTDRRVERLQADMTAEIRKASGTRWPLSDAPCRSRVSCSRSTIAYCPSRSKRGGSARVRLASAAAAGGRGRGSK